MCFILCIHFNISPCIILFLSLLYNRAPRKNSTLNGLPCINILKTNKQNKQNIMLGKAYDVLLQDD